MSQLILIVITFGIFAAAVWAFRSFKTQSNNRQPYGQYNGNYGVYINSTKLILQFADDESDIIQTNLLCTQCQYNLYGLKVSFHCPECGHSIHLSLDHIRNEFTEPSYLTYKRLAANSFRICILSTASCIGLFLIFGITMAIVGEDTIWHFISLWVYGFIAFTITAAISGLSTLILFSMAGTKHAVHRAKIHQLLASNTKPTTTSA